MSTEEILNEREKTHGDFEEVAILAYDIEKPVYDYLMELKGKGLDKQLDKKRILAIKMIMLKIARIVCGDEDHADHWDDIAGYAMLGKGKEEPTEFEKEYCTPLDNMTGKVEFWEEGAACRVCKKEISKGTQICYWCAINEGENSTCRECELSMRFGDKGLLCEKHMEEGATRPKEDYQVVDRSSCIRCDDPFLGPGFDGLCFECDEIDRLAPKAILYHVECIKYKRWNKSKFCSCFSCKSLKEGL